MAEKAFTKIQIGLEAVNGTAVAADTVLLGEAQPIGPDFKNELIEEAIGSRGRGVRIRGGDTKFISDKLRFPNAYYQLLPLLFSCGLAGNITPVEQTGGQGDYLWDFDPSLTASNDIDSLTLEVGDDVDCFEREYVMFEGIHISWDIPQEGGNAAVLVEGMYFARQNTKAAFTAALSKPTTENIVGKTIRMYIDTSWANLGNTEVAICRKGDLNILTGVHPKFVGSQYKYFDTHGEGDISLVGNFTFEGDASADDISDLADNQSISFLRLEVEGAQIGAGDNHKLTIDAAGYWDSVIKMAEVDKGNNLHSAIFSTLEDTTASKVLRVQVITDVSAI